MSEAFLSYSSRKQFGSLDGLRALSIAGVVWHHAARGADLPFAAEGAMGVPLFFAISGFLITTLLLRERDRTGRISLAAFYARRSLRIFPLYYAVLLLYVLVVAFLESDAGRKGLFFHNIRYFATYTSNWFVPLARDRVVFYFAWSLATEEQFYVVWPSVEKYLGGLRRHLPALVAIALVGAWIAVRTGFAALPPESFVRTVVVSIAPAICMGVVLAHALSEERGFSVAAPFLGTRAMSLVLLASVVASLLAGAEILSFALMTLLVGSCVVREDHWLARVLGSGPLARVGKVSYGIYLLHMLVINVVEKLFARVGIESRAAIFAASLIAVWGAAELSFRHFESRFLAMKRAFVR